MLNNPQGNSDALQWNGTVVPSLALSLGRSCLQGHLLAWFSLSEARGGNIILTTVLCFKDK